MLPKSSAAQVRAELPAVNQVLRRCRTVPFAQSIGPTRGHQDEVLSGFFAELSQLASRTNPVLRLPCQNHLGEERAT